jgi:hypothetical protein
MHRIHRNLLFGCCTAMLYGQTQVDLRTQSKSIDFSGANATKPVKSGTVFPSTCNVAEMFYKSDAAPGANLYACTALNTWTVEAGGSGGGLPAVGGNSGKVLTTDGASLFFGSLGGDISGPATSASVTQIQGRPVSSAAPASGQSLAWNAITSHWEPQTISGGSGGGGGVSMASQLGDFAVTRTSATVLTIGANCSTATPCTVRFGSLVYSIVAGATATISAGTGAAYFYVSSSGSLVAGHNLTLGCSATCTAQGGISSFPPDSMPLFRWSATNAAWDANGGSDMRAFTSTKVVQPGAGMTSTETSGATILGVDPAFIGARMGVPANSSSACVTGSYSFDGTYYYLCVSSNSWRRTALATF